MSERQDCTPFDFDTMIPGYTRLKRLEALLESIETSLESLGQRQFENLRGIVSAIDQLWRKIGELKHPILEKKAGEIPAPKLDVLEREIMQLQSQVAS